MTRVNYGDKDLRYVFAIKANNQELQGSFIL